MSTSLPTLENERTWVLEAPFDVAAVTAARGHNHGARHLGSGRIEVHCAGLYMKDSVNRMENGSQRKGNFARLWIDYETLLLRERVGCQQERQS